MMEDGGKAVGAEEPFQSLDVAEIVASALEGDEQSPPLPPTDFGDWADSARGAPVPLFHSPPVVGQPVDLSPVAKNPLPPVESLYGSFKLAEVLVRPF